MTSKDQTPKVSSTKLELHYRSWVYTTTLIQKPSLASLTSRPPPKKAPRSQSSSTQSTTNLKLASSTPIRRAKRSSSPNSNQSPEPNPPSSDQPSRSLTLADANHALGIFSLGLAFRVHDAVDCSANTEIRRRFDDERQIACALAQIVHL